MALICIPGEVRRVNVAPVLLVADTYRVLRATRVFLVVVVPVGYAHRLSPARGCVRFRPSRRASQMAQHVKMLDPAVPMAVTATEWVARYKPPTVTVAVLKTRWRAAASWAERAKAGSSVDVEFVALGVLHSHRVVIEATVAQGSGDSGPEIGQPPGLSVDSLRAGGERDRTALDYRTAAADAASRPRWRTLRGAVQARIPGQRPRSGQAARGPCSR
jgi:hypothetical protein